MSLWPVSAQVWGSLANWASGLGSLTAVSLALRSSSRETRRRVDDRRQARHLVVAAGWEILEIFREAEAYVKLPRGGAQSVEQVRDLEERSKRVEHLMQAAINQPALPIDVLRCAIDVRALGSEAALIMSHCYNGDAGRDAASYGIYFQQIRAKRVRTQLEVLSNAS